MKPLSLNMSKMKKVSGDDKKTLFQHDDGHQITIAHSALSHIQRKQIEKMPVHKFADGGLAIDELIGLSKPSDKKAKELYAADDAKKEKDSTPGFIAERPAPPETKIDDLDPVKQGFADVFKIPEAQAATSEQMQKMSSPIQQQQLVESPEVPLQSVPGPVVIPSQANQDPYGYDQYSKNAMSAIDEQKKGQMGMAYAQAALGKANADVEKSHQLQLQADADAHLKARAPIEQARNDLQNDLANAHIDADHYIKGMSTGSKISTAIGLILGGLGAGLSGGPNVAAQFLQKQIDNDMESQKENLGKKNNLLSHNLQSLKNLDDAYAMTRIQTNDIAASKLRLEAGKAQNKMGAAAALNAAGVLDAQSATLQNEMVKRKMQMGGANGQDPAKLVPLLVPKEHQAKAFTEIEMAENTKKMADSIMKSFDDAAKDNTVIKTGAGMARTPPSVYSLHQAMQPTFKDLEGTVRQAAMDNTFTNITPRPGDMDSTIETKRKALADYLQSKMSAPTARGYGIDLTKYGRTSPYNGSQAPSSTNFGFKPRGK